MDLITFIFKRNPGQLLGPSFAALDVQQVHIQDNQYIIHSILDGYDVTIHTSALHGVDIPPVDTLDDIWSHYFPDDADAYQRYLQWD